jgi:hypothetical protein
MKGKSFRIKGRLCFPQGLTGCREDVTALNPYAAMRRQNRAEPDSPFFISRRGDAVTRSNAEKAFCRLRASAGVLRDDGNPRHQTATP